MRTILAARLKISPAWSRDCAALKSSLLGRLAGRDGPRARMVQHEPALPLRMTLGL